ncbi:tRNA guanosine(34) transglycosylase Tgt [Flavilitoribacter nigricans]|uniref:Queuine tRNA-ribosyltransferase n=1 Tax=Flavilitoribacter nigricans (strain ATCC 23147 / DSM 23189 / NBRC 102662 / NCIMB 1420 / SS-2) TaxID=1122177 RepID=A0A2D0NB81_FLAN2|nr:tRNA guanosine(34) transglycosylase Tgt [Flavilitoribacter nigricans]PHN05620.1 tRNA guanosine(34) transglycosylase Tgt [Flavilitoribacter nigricans DSM 23189 = NBRC 102662]
MFTFDLQHTDPASSARAGLIQTDHGPIETPIFMPVGTAGTVKGVHQYELKNDIGAQIILGNTYHLYLRPGMEVMAKAGGLHGFNGWQGPILTDSGGYQVYSLSDRRKITEEGVTFRSHIDGSKHTFSPERSMEIQRVIGADIIMAFDECPPFPCDYKYAKDSMDLTHRWLARCCEYVDNTEGHYGHGQTLFPIVQGSTYDDLRRASAEAIASFDRAGNAIGGLSVGEPAEEMYRVTDMVCAILPKDKPRYLMGVGTPVNLLECIALGIDMFDCVLPTRNARHGMLYTAEGIINIKNAKWKDDFSPVDPDSSCPSSRFYTRGYLRHLIHSGELLGAQIASLHNLAFFLWLVGEARKHIIAGDFASWKNDMVPRLERRL